MILSFLFACAAGSVSLRPDAEVRGQTVELGEIADVRCDSPEETQRLAALQLGFSPSPGALRVVKREDVAAALRAAGVSAAPAGAAQCRVRPRVETVTGREVEEAARRALSALFAGRDAEISVVRPAADLQVVAPERARELAADLGRREPLPGSFSVPVDVLVDGARAQTAWIALDVKLYERQPVAARDLLRGEALDASAWRLERAPVEAVGLRPAQPEQLVGATCTRDLQRGARIGESDVRREPLVRSGDVVELEVLRGPIRARSRAVARGQAALGDRVEVQCGESQRRLVGVVVQRGLVRVELAESPRNPR
jgi:flagella basal body P-ring formation protein FlgA